MTVKGPLGSLPIRGGSFIRVDTGYDGFILLSEENYMRIGLKLAELPRRY